jgi:hypothetical protein
VKFTKKSSIDHNLGSNEATIGSNNNEIDLNSSQIDSRKDEEIKERIISSKFGSKPEFSNSLNHKNSDSNGKQSNSSPQELIESKKSSIDSKTNGNKSSIDSKTNGNKSSNSDTTKKSLPIDLLNKTQILKHFSRPKPNRNVCQTNRNNPKASEPKVSDIHSRSDFSSANNKVLSNDSLRYNGLKGDTLLQIDNIIDETFDSLIATIDTMNANNLKYSSDEE